VVSAGASPTATGMPSISGTPMVGSTLQASTGTWSGASSYAYQWTRCNSSGGSCGAIAGATASSYVPVSGDVSSTLRVNVLATNTAGTSTATSPATSAVQSNATLGSVTQPWFTSDSPFNTPIPSSAGIDPNSATWVNQLYNNASVNSIFVNQTAWSTTVYHASSTTPTIPIYVSNLNKHIDLPYLSGWTTSPDSDAHMVVIDDSSGCEYEFEALNLTNRSANSVAVFHVTTGSGAHAPDAGVTGAQTSLLAGLITPQDVASGAINHALRIGTPINSSQYRLPATHSDGSLAGGIPEGALIRLDPTLDLSQYGLTAFQLMLAKALQKYGAYDGDNGGSLAVSAQVNGSYSLPITWLPKSMVLHLQVMAPLWTSVPTETNYTAGCHNPY
jgi:predicted actin-binding protein